MLYDITAKDLCKYYPVYTKAGFIWKNRINWEVIQVPGNKVKTYFGIFTFLRAYKVDKVWYWVLTDGTKTITVKRDQARKNKKLPKSATIQTTLMLAQPKELIDRLVEQVERLVKQYNEQLINDPNNYTRTGKFKKVAQESMLETYEQFIQDPQYDTVFENKIDFISNGLDSWGDRNLTKHIYKQLKRTYHPDNVNVNSDYYFTFINKKFKNI